MGILGASTTSFNLLRKALEIKLAEMLSEFFAMYEAWVHMPVFWVFDELNLPHPPVWAIDVTVLWLLIGGIVLRSTWTVRTSVLNSPSRYANSGHGLWDWLFEHRSNLPVFIFMCVVLWPVVGLFLVISPFIYREPSTGLIMLRGARQQQGVFVCDMRLVLLIQTLTALTCVGLWLGVNLFLDT